LTASFAAATAPEDFVGLDDVNKHSGRGAVMGRARSAITLVELVRFDATFLAGRRAAWILR